MSLRYQLGVRDRRHTAYVFFDDHDERSRRLCVMCTIRKLSNEENEAAKAAIVERHGAGVLHRRHDGSSLEDVELEFFKYLIVHHGSAKPQIYDMETLQELQPCSQKKLLRDETTVLRELEASSTGTGRQASVVLETRKHGRVTLTLRTYEDPNERCGIDISVAGVLTPETATGALVKATHPKHIMCKKWMRLPPRLKPAQIRAVNSSDYFTPREVVVEKKDGSFEHRRMLFPRTRAAFPDRPGSSSPRADS